MIIYSLFMLIALIAFGVLAMYLARTISKVQHSGLQWWDRTSLFFFFSKGFGVALLFLFLAAWVLKGYAWCKYVDSSSLDYILEKMEYQKPHTMEDKQLVEQVQKWLETDGSNADSEYATLFNGSEENPNFLTMRNAFINSYVTDPAPELFTVNPYGLTYYVAGEKENGLEACQSASGTFLIMWAKILTRGDINTDSISVSNSNSCAEVLATPMVDFYEGRGVDVGGDEDSCKVTEQISEVDNHISDRILPSIGTAFAALFSGEFQTDSSRSILTSIPQKKNCGSVFSKEIQAMETQLLSAQLNILREEAAPAFRMGAIVFGPIQLVLLTIFFAACIGLGKRRTLSLENGKRLKDIFDKRVGIVKQEIEADGRTGAAAGVDIQAIKNVLIRELDEEASFPFTFATYVLGMVGFIGTVIGIAASLASSGEVVRAAGQGIAAQEEAISQVTGMLGVAFDTTLIALGTSALVYYIYNYIRSTEMALIRSFK